MTEKVNHPSHYQSGEVEEDGTSKYEAIKVIEAWDLNFHLGNVANTFQEPARSQRVVLRI